MICGYDYQVFELIFTKFIVSLYLLLVEPAIQSPVQPDATFFGVVASKFDRCKNLTQQLPATGNNM